MNIDDIMVYSLLNTDYTFNNVKINGNSVNQQLFNKYFNDLMQILDVKTDNTTDSSGVLENLSNNKDDYSGCDINNIIDNISENYGIDSNLVKAVVKQESSYNTMAVSGAGAQGLMQLMPDTAKGLGVNNAFDPVQNINGGVKYLKELFSEFGDVKKVLAAYNAGPGYIERNGLENLPKETKNYINNVLYYKSQFDKKG